MLASLLRGLIHGVPKILGITVVVFVLLHLSGDPTFILLPPEAGPEHRAAFRRVYGLDRPLPIQYLAYVGRLVQGDFGESFSFREPALRVVLRRLPGTLELTAAAVLVAVVLAIPAGVVAAMRRGTMVDRGLMGLSLLGQSVPTFWLGMMMILVFAVQLRWLPVSGRGSLAHLAMPALALAVWLIALLARITRAEMLEVLALDYVRTARAKGLAELAVAGRHALKNASLPILTVLGLQLGGLLGGAVMTETVFAWPGVGTLILEAILKKDFPVVLAGVVFIATTFIVLHVLLDLVLTWADPRVQKV